MTRTTAEPGKIRFAPRKRGNLRFLLVGLIVALVAGCVPGQNRPDSGMDGQRNASLEMRSQLSLDPEQWRIARKYAAVAGEFYGYEYIPARVERFSEADGVTEVDIAFRMPDGETRRVRVTGRPVGDGDTRSVRVAPLGKDDPAP